MAKAQQRLYRCQSCGAETSRWAGQCPHCDEWNTLVEEAAVVRIPKGLKGGTSSTLAFTDLTLEAHDQVRFKTGISEFDRVCGGGLVKGSLLLVGGNPGIGKSTLLLQAIARLASNHKVAYISGEEALAQIKMRASRLGVSESPVNLAAHNNMREILATLEGPEPPEIVIIDSIQTVFIDNIEAAPGTVSQVRACTHELMRVAKARGLTLLIVGHVTKEGMIAGPKVLEHMVDGVLTFEGDQGHHFRLLRATKNRFGPTDEVGVFEMTQQGLSEVQNPSMFFLGERSEGVSGSVVFASVEGTRPLLMEIQALVAPSPLSMPRRTVIGWDQGRLSMLTAVLQTRCNLTFHDKDIFLNVTGGLKIQETGADLAVAAALVSSLTQTPLPPHVVVFGEVGLSGEIRRLPFMDLRLKEAQKLGFTEALMPSLGKGEEKFHLKIRSLSRLSNIRDVFKEISREQ